MNSWTGEWFNQRLDPMEWVVSSEPSNGPEDRAELGTGGVTTNLCQQ